jgi:hypothetical protein
MRGVWHTVRDLFRPLDEGPRWAREAGVLDAKAHEQSLQLLVRNPSPAQRQQFARYDYFDVIGGDTGKRYRIRVGRTLNVAQLNASGGCVRMLCFEPQGTLPVGDIMLAQKLALELFESDAIKVANASPMWELDRELLWPDRHIGRHDHLRRSRHQW